MDRAIVRDNRDPSGRGRLRVQIPTRTGTRPTDWIWPVVSAGYVVLPKPGDQVWVDYEGGDTNFPVWVGKAQVTTTHKTPTGLDVGDVSNLLARVKELETRLQQAESQIETLFATKANVGHSH